MTLSVLITGCSAGGMGEALATALHDSGHHVFATARDPQKMAKLTARGIQTFALDISSDTSIEASVNFVSAALPQGKGLDMLINNAAGAYSMPIADASIAAAKSLFDVNVWAHIAVTQAFLPLLLQASSIKGSTSNTLIVNHTSVGSIAALPFQGIYNSSKAALAMLTDTMRMELAPFNIRVVDLKTAGVRTNIITNNNVNSAADSLPRGSIYEPAREIIEAAMSQKNLAHIGISPEQWATEVADLLLSKNPPAVIWKGESARIAQIASKMPCNVSEGFLKKMTKLDVVEQIITEARR